ncbi:alpha/beta hydrolase fold domain-containing protein [Amycolatopsis sp. cmx-4-68]|uniref:alpha/beta hydrolase fold domain-containing protein n=1 Tax=Amycolatopsis sp. cmx-4-68 TaxID=2790938 RepID=UPI00397CCBED
MISPAQRLPQELRSAAHRRLRPVRPRPGKPLARHCAVGAGCVALRVAYRLAPEDPFPAVAHDVRDVVLWVWESAAELRIARPDHHGRIFRRE